MIISSESFSELTNTCELSCFSCSETELLQIEHNGRLLRDLMVLMLSRFFLRGVQEVLRSRDWLQALI